tara:strand:+ start:2629 stop:3351 length:723 start_codon:yes stop_codon:yes gene_type:complete
MKILRNSFFATLMLMMSGTVLAQAAGTTDNEILLQQVGDTLDLTIIQTGYGNKISGDNSEGSDLIITGTSLNIDIDQIGNSNKFYGKIISDSSTLDWTFTGNSNIWDIMMGDSGSADSANILAAITGDSNTMDFDLGSVVSAENLDMDFTLLGDSNAFNVDIEVDDATWNFDITGDSNNFLTSQTDGAYHYMKVEHDGDSGDFDLIQSSGTCPQGTSSCFSYMDLSIDSENATVQITQQD